jgi:hypothetical protein
MGTPDCGEGISGPYTSYGDYYSVQFAKNGGYVRHGKSIISDVGCWAAVGYLWHLLDREATDDTD